MSWVRRSDPADDHCCDQPMREVVSQIPPQLVGSDGRPMELREQVPDGRVGDLWRCACGALWRIGHACDPCDRTGGRLPHAGGHAIGIVWRPATLWQRIRYRKGRP